MALGVKTWVEYRGTLYFITFELKELLMNVKTLRVQKKLLIPIG